MVSTMPSMSSLGVPGVAFVTGGGSGIGRATCHLLAREGVRGLAIADINDIDANRVKLEAEGLATNAKFQCITMKVDVRDEQSIKNTISAIVETYGRLDYAVNCAGVGIRKAFNEIGMADWDRVIAINLTAVFACVKAEAEQMLKQEPLESASSYHPLQQGSIVNVASAAAFTGFRHSGPYAAAKHGVVGITRSYALDYPEIKINAVTPGYTKTPLIDPPGGPHPTVLETVNNWTPMKRLGLPEEIAEGIVWLLGSRSNFAHGSCLTMDGGYLAR